MSSFRSLTDEQVVSADVAAELDGGKPVVALLVGRWQSERSDLIDHLCARLASNSTRVIRIATSGAGSVDIRGFCNLLVAAAPAGTIAGDDPAERLRGVLANPHAGKRRLTLIVEDADALSTVALAFVMRLAVASSARPRRVQVLLLGSHALQPRLAGIGPAAVKRLDEIPTSGLNPLPTKRRTREVLLALAATGCLAAVVVTGTLRPGADNRLSAKAGAALEAQPALGRPSVAFALSEAGSTMAPSESTSLFPTLTLAQSVQKDAAELPADAAPMVAPNSGFAPQPQPQTATPSPPTEPAPQREAEAVTEAIAELLAQLDALLARRSAGGAAASDAEITELLTQLDALLARRPAEDVAPPGVAQSASPATPLDPPSTPAPAPALEAASGTTTTAVAPPPAGPPAVPLTPTGPLAAPAAPVETAAPGTATAVEAVQSGTGSLAAPAPPAEAAAPSAATAAEAVQSGTGSLAAPARPAETAEPGTATAGANAAQSGTESVAAPARPAGTAVTSMATAAVAGAARPAEPQRPPAGAPPAAVAALLARGDALIAFGDVAAARLVYQRAAARDSARGATAMGRTYDPRFLQSIGAIGVVADPDAAAAWYRKGAALGDEDAAPLLGGLK
jgi:hypothetical protein